MQIREPYPYEAHKKAAFGRLPFAIHCFFTRVLC